MMMPNRLEFCSRLTMDKIIKLEDKKGGRTTIYFHNNIGMKVQVIDVDCLNLSGKSCDYSLRMRSHKTEIYIELKGCRVDDAIEQLENTIKGISPSIKTSKKWCFIVHTRCPSTTRVQNEKAKFKRDYHAILKTVKSNYKENLENFL